MKNSAEEILNRLLVQLFNDILHIEEKAMKNTEFTDLSITEIHTIEAIGTEGNRTMGEIAHDLRITVGTLTTAINRLIKKGYVERKRIEEDRRVVLVSLTESGKAVFLTHSEFHKEMIDEILESFQGEDLEVLNKILRKAIRFFERKYQSFQ
ncbi:MAG: MarR family transcriptional regulator [Turicibacter sp.]|nr:MarR family transcriptional regulator [Turicibacter sp.]